MDIQHATLSDYTSLRIGGGAIMVVVTTVEEMKEAIVYAKAEGLRVHILGGGTNTYFDTTLKNLFVIKNEIKGIEIQISDSQTVRQSDKNDTILITIGAGETWDDVVLYAVEHGYWGIENLSYIPGTVGAAPVQNIGAYGTELKDTFVSLTAIDKETLEVIKISNSMCQFGYRDSILKQQPNRFAICFVTLQLSQTPRPILSYSPLDRLVGQDDLTLETIRATVIATRMAKLPDWKEHPNAGSFFKNPIVSQAEAEGFRLKFPLCPVHETQKGDIKIPAAWLIEHVARMKGVRVGDVGTWPLQPLVIVNFGHADAQAVNDLALDIIQKVHTETGILLEKEVNFVA